jgi:hypothetical protein
MSGNLSSAIFRVTCLQAFHIDRDVNLVSMQGQNVGRVATAHSMSFCLTFEVEVLFRIYIPNIALLTSKLAPDQISTRPDLFDAVAAGPPADAIATRERIFWIKKRWAGRDRIERIFY